MNTENVNAIIDNLKSIVSVDVDHLKLDAGDNVMIPTSDNVLLKAVSEDFRSIGIIGNKLPNVNFKTFIVVAIGPMVKEGFKIGDHVNIKRPTLEDPTFWNRYGVSGSYCHKSFGAWAKDFFSMTRSDQNIFVENNPTIKLVEYVIMPSYNIDGYISK